MISLARTHLVPLVLKVAVLASVTVSGGLALAQSVGVPIPSGGPHPEEVIEGTMHIGPENGGLTFTTWAHGVVLPAGLYDLVLTETSFFGSGASSGDIPAGSLALTQPTTDPDSCEDFVEWLKSFAVLYEGGAYRAGQAYRVRPSQHGSELLPRREEQSDELLTVCFDSNHDGNDDSGGVILRYREGRHTVAEYWYITLGSGLQDQAGMTLEHQGQTPTLNDVLDDRVTMPSCATTGTRHLWYLEVCDRDTPGGRQWSQSMCTCD